MNKRLIWNFEVNHDKPIPIESWQEPKEELLWEARFFWDDRSFICLEGLAESLVQFKDVEAKHQEDSYLLHPLENFNLKKRRGALLYKPKLQEKEGLCAYGKKINLTECLPALILPASNNRTVGILLDELNQTEKEILIHKDVLLFKFSSKPKLKLELSRLVYNDKIYFSLCIQGRSFSLVSTLAKDLLGNARALDYVSFLRQEESND